MSKPTKEVVKQISGKDKEEYREMSRAISLSKLFDALGIVKTPMQEKISILFDSKLALWNQLNLVASRRSGKTYTAAVIITRELLIPNSSVVCVSKSAKSMANLFKEILKNLRTLGIKTDKINSQQYFIQIGESVFRGGMISATEGLLSSRASLLVLDEAGVYAYREQLAQELSPMRLDFGAYPETGMFVAKILLVSSPRFIGSDFYEDAEEGLPPVKDRYKHERNDLYISDTGQVTLNYNIYDSPLLTDQMRSAIEQSETDELVFKTEYLAQFVPFSASNVFIFKEENIYDYGKFMEDMKKNKELGLMTGELPLFIGLDIGYKDNSAITVSTVIENVMYVLDVFDQGMMTVEDIAKTLRGLIYKWENHPILPLSLYHGTIHSDPAALQTNQSLILDYDIPIQNGYNRIKEGVDYINLLFNHNLLRIPHNQSRLIQQLTLVAYSDSSMHSINANKTDPFIKAPKGVGHWDILSAFRYSVTTVGRQFNMPDVPVFNYEDMDYSTYTDNGTVNVV